MQMLLPQQFIRAQFRFTQNSFMRREQKLQKPPRDPQDFLSSLSCAVFWAFVVWFRVCVLLVLVGGFVF